MAPGGGMSRTLRRYLSLLHHIPGEGRRIGTDRLISILAGEDLSVTARTVQRDLEALQTEFPTLCCDDRHKPYGWYWRRGATPLGIPTLGLSAALTHELIHKHLSAVLPRTLVRALKPSFDHARKTLKDNPDTRLARWSRSVRALPTGLPKQAPEVRLPVMETVYEALYSGGRFEADYRKPGHEGTRKYEVSPLGLVLRDGRVTVVCTFWDYTEVNHLSLHRIVAARNVDKAVRAPRGFNLDKHIRSGQLGFLVGPPLTLKARIQVAMAERLEDTPIGEEQSLGPVKDGWCRLESRVHDSMELRGWLRSLGPLVEVTGPKKLRAAMTEDVAALARLYSLR